MTRDRLFKSKLAGALAALLAGGTMTASCETRLKENVVEGSVNYFFSFMAAQGQEFLVGLAEADTGP